MKSIPPRALGPGLLLCSLLAGCAEERDGASIGPHGAEGIGYADPNRAGDASRIDEIMMGPVREGTIAGASVAVYQYGAPVAVRGYGWANLELEAPTPEHAIYEIGSVTKQFTSAGLLRLQEEGLLDLDDQVVHYLPDAPTQGRSITLRELLDHTSGMRGYTEMLVAYPYFVRRVERDSLLELIREHPFDFEPGEHAIYNNSAYFLAGMALEEVSGRSYEEYVEEEFFEPLGMERSHYCSETEVVRGKTTGYDFADGELAHKGFIVHNVPFSAGSLCASADDIAKWLLALHSGSVLSEDAYRQLLAPGDLNDGTLLRYGLGIAISDILGHAAAHHGGGINGFLAESIFLPDEDLIVVVLQNSTGPPGPASLAREIIRALAGERAPEAEGFPGNLAPFAGEYEGPMRGGTGAVRISAAGGKLYASALMTAGSPVPESARDSSELAWVRDRVFADGENLFVFEDPALGPSPTLRFDAVAGYTVLARR